MGWQVWNQSLLFHNVRNCSLSSFPERDDADEQLRQPGDVRRLAEQDAPAALKLDDHGACDNCGHLHLHEPRVSGPLRPRGRVLLQKAWSEPSSLRGHAKGVNFGTLTTQQHFRLFTLPDLDIEVTGNWRWIPEDDLASFRVSGIGIRPNLLARDSSPLGAMA